MSQELARTRRYEVSDFPPGTRMMMGDRRDLDAALKEGRVRAVGKFNTGANGVTTVPVVYVAKRTVGQRWYQRRGVHIAEIVVGSVLFVAAGIAAIILTVGLAWFIVGVVAMAVAIATLVRYSRGGGGGGRRGVSVTTTTTTNVRVR